MKTRTYLLIFALAILLPMVGFSVFVLLAYDRQQRAEIERGGTETARALMNAVDRELLGVLTVLKVLASSRAIEDDDLAGVHRDLGSALVSQRDWLTILLIAPPARILVDATVPFGAPIAPVREPASLEAAFRTGQPAFGNIALGNVTRRHGFPVRLPVLRQGTVAYVLTAVLEPPPIAAILERQQVPGDWVATVFDAHRNVVARSRNAEQFVGRPISAEFARLLDAAPEGRWAVTHTLEGIPVYTAYSRSPLTGWGVGLGIPPAAVDAPLRRSLLAMGAGGAAVLLLAMAAAAFLATRTAGAILELVAAVRAAADGRDVAVPTDRGPHELRVVAQALADAREAQRRTGDARARLGAIVDSSEDPIVGKTLEGLISSWNRAAERMFGYTASEAIGQNIRLIIPTDRWAEEDRVLAQIRAGNAVDHFETVRRAKDGREIQVSLTVSPVRDDAGRVIGSSKIARDITERKRVETERTALLVRAEQARVEAETANRAKDEFLTVLSHELRTPLNAVYGWARMLQAGTLGAEDSAKALDAIVRNANAQVQLIDDLLDVSRVITGKMRLDVRPVDLNAVIEAALDTVRPAAEAKEIRLQSVLDPQAGPITGDPDRLQQVVWNLLMNAVKFTPKRGRVQVELLRINSHVEIVVSDTGQGIPPGVLPFIFERFTQADSSPTRAHGGLGLGLALVKYVVELHGGSVTAESAGEGQGATFIVKLPLPIAQIPPEPMRVHPTASGLESGGPPSRLDGLRVLVVDDDRDALLLASAILERAGALVRTSLSASDGLGLFTQWRPDVLVSDIEMPQEDGYALIRKIRALDAEQGGRTPAVALTAYGRAEDRVRSLSAGYSMHVPKPVDPSELTTIIASIARRG